MTACRLAIFFSHPDSNVALSFEPYLKSRVLRWLVVLFHLRLLGAPSPDKTVGVFHAHGQFRRFFFFFLGNLIMPDMR